MLKNTDFENKLEIALDEIRPFLKSDGGDIEVVDYTEETVRVRLLGACRSCSVNQMTLKNGIEMTIKKHLPQVQNVEEVIEK